MELYHDTSIEAMLDAAYEEIDDRMFEEARANLEMYGTTVPPVQEEQPVVWAVNSAGHRYNPHPTVYFHSFFKDAEGRRIACFSFVNTKLNIVREARKYAVIDYDLRYAPLIGKTMRVTMRQEPKRWYILDPKAPSKPVVEPVKAYVFSESEDEQFAKLCE